VSSPLGSGDYVSANVFNKAEDPMIHLAPLCACLLNDDGLLSRPCWAHWLQMLRNVFHRSDL
jgi:hypothetical protein